MFSSTVMPLNKAMFWKVRAIPRCDRAFAGSALGCQRLGAPGPGEQRMLSIAGVAVTRVEEVILHEATTLFAEWTDEKLEQHRDVLLPHCFDPGANAFYASIHSYLVKTPRQMILIDTCGGNEKPLPASPRIVHLNTPWLDRLRGGGAPPQA